MSMLIDKLLFHPDNPVVLLVTTVVLTALLVMTSTVLISIIIIQAKAKAKLRLQLGTNNTNPESQVSAPKIEIKENIAYTTHSIKHTQD